MNETKQNKPNQNKTKRNETARKGGKKEKGRIIIIKIIIKIIIRKGDGGGVPCWECAERWCVQGVKSNNMPNNELYYKEN